MKRPKKRFLSMLLIIGCLLFGGIQGALWASVTGISPSSVTPDKSTANSVYTFTAHLIHEAKGHEEAEISRLFQGSEVTLSGDKLSLQVQLPFELPPFVISRVIGVWEDKVGNGDNYFLGYDNPDPKTGIVKIALTKAFRDEELDADGQPTGVKHLPVVLIARSSTVYLVIPSAGAVIPMVSKGMVTKDAEEFQVMTSAGLRNVDPALKTVNGIFETTQYFDSGAGQCSVDSDRKTIKIPESFPPINITKILGVWESKTAMTTGGTNYFASYKQDAADKYKITISLNAALPAGVKPYVALKKITSDYQPFQYASGLSSRGSTSYTHSYYFLYTKITDDSGTMEADGSDSYAGPTVVDSTPGLYGGIGNQIQYLRNWEIGIDPLVVEPLDTRYPDDGTGSSTYTFRVRYYNKEGLLPRPYYGSGQDPWNDTTYASGVVLYLDDECNGKYQPHFMAPVDPADVDSTDGIDYIYKIVPQASSGKIGMPNITSSTGAKLYQSLIAGVHKYYFAGASDYMLDWDGTRIFDPNLARNIDIDDPANYSTIVDLVRLANGPDDAYPFYYGEHPKSGPVLYGIDGARGFNPRFLGTISPYKTMYAPPSTGNTYFETSGLSSNEEAVLQVKYVNADAEPPLWIKVFINNGIDATSSYTGYTMTLAPDQGDLDYTQGVIYQYRIKLLPGPHTYYFAAADKTRTTIYPTRMDTTTIGDFTYDDPYVPFKDNPSGNDFVPGPYVNRPLILSNPSVTPTSGRQGYDKDFTYEVTYSDPDGQKPYAAYVIIQLHDNGTLEDGGAKRVAMTPVKTNSDGSIVYQFRSSTTQDIVLEPGERHYYFEFWDNWGKVSDPNIIVEGERTRLPASENIWIAGPTVVTNHAPTLDGNVEATDTAQNTASSWIYSVNYVDLDNDAPSYVRVEIDPGDGSSVTLNNMTPQNAGDQTYTDGRIYEFKTTLGTAGNYRFRFIAKDGIDETVGPWQDGPIVKANTPPTLTLGMISIERGAPSSADEPTTFTYKVTYRDVDGEVGQAPNYVKVVIDKVDAYTMTEVDTTDVTYNDGKLYQFSTTLPAGAHSYHFEASDGKDKVATQEINRPLVYDSPKLEDPNVTPTQGDKDTDYVFTVTYRAPNGQGPNSGSPMLFVDDRDGVGSGMTMTKVNPTDTNYVAGVQYRKIVQGLAAGAHSFHFKSVTTIKLNGVNVDDATVYTEEVTDKPMVENKIPVLTNPSLDPIEGSQNDKYTFTVTYSDEDNDAPQYVKVKISSTDGNSKTFDLAPADTNTNYVLGATYSAQISGTDIGGGDHTYQFIARDVNGVVDAVLKPSNADGFAGPTINAIPVLSSPSVSPDSGTARTSFTYSVTYKDPEGKEASYVRVLIDESFHTMVKDANSSDFVNGVTYTYTTTLETGVQHSYRFEASDGIDVVKLPIEGPNIQGPTVADNFAPVLTDQTISYTGTTTADVFTWNIKVTDANDEEPTFVKIYIDGAGVDMTRKDTTPFKDGSVYEYSTRLTAGVHTYYFKASDGIAPDVTNPETGLPESAYTTPNVEVPPTWFDSGVTPTAGTTETTFKFYVSYHTDAATPELTMNLNLDGNTVTMQKVDPTDTNFGDGVKYFYETKLQPSSAQKHTYSFAVTGNETSSYPTDGSVFEGPEVTALPTLTEASVKPENTRINGSLSLSVKYADPEGVAPSIIKAVINDQEFDMVTADTAPDYTKGVVYTFETGPQAESKTLNIQFKASDGIAEVIAPEDPIIAKVNNKPTLTNEMVDPSSGSTTKPFTYKVTYTDADNDAPQYITLFMSRDGGQTWTSTAMTKSASDVNYAQGVVYSYTTTIKNPGDMRYKMKAWDGITINAAEDATETAVHVGPVMTYAAITLTAPESVMLTQSASLTGTLVAEDGSGLANQSVLITCFRPDGTDISQSTTTNANGEFSLNFTPDMDNLANGTSGTTPWTVRASWAGNSARNTCKTDKSMAVTPAEKVIPSSYTMISIPVLPLNDQIDTLFNPIQNVKLAYWMPDQGEYAVYGTSSNFPNWNAGMAIWAKAPSSAKIKVSGRLASPTASFVISLKKGWNQISSPHYKPVNFANLMVEKNDNQVSIDSTTAQGWVRNYAWRWDITSGTYKMVGSSYTETTLQPWEGYWIRALDDCSLIIPAVSAQ